MRFEIVTIFPGFFPGFLENGILRRALAEGLVEVGVHDLRGFTHDRHRTVDDRPFGGGEGMVLKAEPLAEALASLGIGPKAAFETCQGTTSVVPNIQKEDVGALAPEGGPLAQRPAVILLSAQGRRFTQATARELTTLGCVVLICGRYEGVDERINELYCDMELSIGDYVLSGGELAAAVVVDATMRLIPGVLGNEASGEFESFGVADAEIHSDTEGVPRSQHGAGGLLDYPHYTRPAEFGGLRAPEVLLNGDHLEIRRWRREQQDAGQSARFAGGRGVERGRQAAAGCDQAR
jgi:tRNA (guanine37-N1)-methyltransferase